MATGGSHLWMVFDVEAVGLHGEGFAWGAVVIDADGKELFSHKMACPPRAAAGGEDGRAWVEANVPPMAYGAHEPRGVRSVFWDLWQRWKAKGALLAADCAWPVEARFLAACVDDATADREWQGPYPLVDVASVRLAAGLDPLGTPDRMPNELPAHDPLADARQSARLLVEALTAARGGPGTPAPARAGSRCP